MAGIKISQLLEVEEVEPGDYLAVARGGIETYKTPATQFVKSGQNIGSGSGLFYKGITDTEPPALLFRSLSASGEGLSISNVGDTVVINTIGQTPTVTSHVGDGTTKVFIVNGANSKFASNYRVDIDGILQQPDRDYILNPATLRIEFNTAPPINSKIVIVTNNLLTTVETDFKEPVIDTTVQYVLNSNDHLKNICMDSNSANIVLIPNTILIPGFTVTIIQTGLGQTQIDSGIGVTLRAPGSPPKNKLTQQYSAATLVYINSVIGWVLYGDLTA